MIDSLNIFIPAAGLGERLRPITEHIPKPLVPVLGKPVLQHVLDALSVLPFRRIGINLFHMRDILEAWVSRCPLRERIVLFPERTMLGTGGALRNAEGFLKEGTFLVHNSDILSDMPLEKLLDFHRSSDNLVTLAVHDCRQYNVLVLDDQGCLTGIKRDSGGDKRSAFMGIAVYEPDFMKFLPPGASSVVDAWLKALDKGCRIGTFDVSRQGYESPSYWSDVGTPSAYAAAVFHALQQEGETLYIHESVRIGECINFRRNVVIEGGCEITYGPALRNCVIMPNSTLRGGHEPVFLENCILGPDFRIDLKEPEIYGCAEGGREKIGTGGSDREYSRVSINNRPAILMECKKDDPDFNRHIYYTRFFLKHSVPVPRLLHADSEKMQALFEDAGDMSLYNCLKCSRKKEYVERLYRLVIDAMICIHSVASSAVSECPPLQERVFDYGHFRWETAYFIERFVKGLKKTALRDSALLDEEFHVLAEKAASYPGTVIHRDFQSQNIMVLEGGRILVIDYQGARIGPPAYDIASLLWDPYYRIDNDLREDLLLYYLEKITGRLSGAFNQTQFRDSLRVCRLQRHMQALGAYAFLALVKGKKYFLKYVPEGLRLLREDIARSEIDYPELKRLIREL